MHVIFWKTVSSVGCESLVTLQPKSISNYPVFTTHQSQFTRIILFFQHVTASNLFIDQKIGHSLVNFDIMPCLISVFTERTEARSELRVYREDRSPVWSQCLQRGLMPGQISVFTERTEARSDLRVPREDWRTVWSQCSQRGLRNCLISVFTERTAWSQVRSHCSRGGGWMICHFSII